MASQEGRASTSGAGAGAAAAWTSSTTTDLVSVLRGPENYATLMALIAETSSKVALTTRNTLLATLRDMTSHQSILPISTPSGVRTVDGSRVGTPIFGASADLPTSGAPPPPKRRMKLDWNATLLSLPSDQNNDVNAKTSLVAERHFKIFEQWKDQASEKKQECITDVRSFYRGTDDIPDSFFRNKFNAWGRNRWQYLNKSIREVSAGKKSNDELRKICSEELEMELIKLSQSEYMGKIREAQKKKVESGNVIVHHLGAGGPRLVKEDFVEQCFFIPAPHMPKWAYVIPYIPRCRQIVQERHDIYRPFQEEEQE
ncbi:hypothetical protein R1sor_010115 [Riccia sorocarpa]|uniref:Uncharacterized protein n=1 Tax=Riccia sorocarpa TaxID=122646 RepID=A0ABD3HZ14_9MARC